MQKEYSSKTNELDKLKAEYKVLSADINNNKKKAETSREAQLMTEMYKKKIIDKNQELAMLKSKLNKAHQDMEDGSLAQTVATAGGHRRSKSNVLNYST